MTSRQPGGVRGPDADGGTTLSAAVLWPGRGLIAVMLVAAAALDLARCGIVLATARHAGPAIGLVAAGLATAALSLRTARGCRSGRRWSAWAALLIGAASAPQAAGSGFHPPYTIPDIATAALGVLLTVAVLATAGPARQPERRAENPCLDLGSTRWPAVRRPVSAPVNSDDLLSVLVDESTEDAGPARARPDRTAAVTESPAWLVWVMLAAALRVGELLTLTLAAGLPVPARAAGRRPCRPERPSRAKHAGG